MSHHSLHDIYSRVQPGYKHVYVVPLIRYDYPKSDYLYLLYSGFFSDKNSTRIHSTSFFSHWKFFLAQLLGLKPILHYHWFEFQDLKSLIGMVYKVKMIWLYTLFGGKLVWTIHNLKPHSNRWLKAHLRLHRWMAKKADKILVHSSGLIEVVSDKYQVPKDKIELLAHPIFPAEIQDKESARLELNKRYQLDLPMNCLVLGSLGAISDYKDFDQILRIMAEFNFSGIYMVFGYVKKGQQDLHNRLSKADKAYDWFIYKPGFVEESDIPIIMNSMDYSLFNFKDISTSGGVELARAYQKDIIAPKKGTLVDYEAEESVQLFSSEDELKTLLTTLSVKP